MLLISQKDICLRTLLMVVEAGLSVSMALALAVQA
jgi:hypothetical protein